MNEDTARELIAVLNRLSVSIDRLTLPDHKLGANHPNVVAAPARPCGTTQPVPDVTQWTDDLWGRACQSHGWPPQRLGQTSVAADQSLWRQT